MVVEDAQTGYVGAVVRIEYGRMELEDRRGRRKPFPVGPGYLIDGKPVILTAPRRAAPAAGCTYRVWLRRSAGRQGQGRAVQPHLCRGSARRRTCRAGVGGRSADRGCGRRIPRRGRRSRRDRRRVRPTAWPPAGRAGRPSGRRVQGGPHGRRGAARRWWRPHAGRRPSVHRHLAGGQARRLGISAWPTVPRGVDWKHGVCDALGWPHAGQADIARAWQRIRGRVRDWNDLEPVLIGRVEELIDFVTQCES